MTVKNASLSSDQINQLVKSALEVRARAYAPYSHYQVGAALLTSAGAIITGCNVENASYGATICAERSAVVKAVSEGFQRFEAVAVITQNGGSPCGMCRQVLYEFNPGMQVILANAAGTVIHTFTLRDLLPEGFGPAQLE